MSNPPKPLMLLILDGWGIAPPNADNAIAQANTPHWDALLANHPHTEIATSGQAVGLPDGQMGNSEVGHMNLGAGRIVFQDFTRISNAVADGSLADNTVIRNALDLAEGRSLHLMGLLSPGGVHSHEDHIFALLEAATDNPEQQVVVHAFLDGRDTPPRSAEASLRKLAALLDTMPNARLGTICGRYFAMDRDNRWDRIQRSWDALVCGTAAFTAEDGVAALHQAYSRDENDEFVQPTIIGDKPHTIDDQDVVIFANFRADRARQLTQAFVQQDFSGFEAKRPHLRDFVTLTEYQQGLPVSVAFPKEELRNTLAEVLANAGRTQLRIAETEKYAHVTFFFSGGKEETVFGETRSLIPSPEVATYDLQPEMSAPEVTDALLDVIEKNPQDVIICNIANPDMVGHSGKFAAAVQAVQAVDKALGVICPAVLRQGGQVLVTADHGNIEQMADASSGQAHTAHTTNPVPLVWVGGTGALKTGGRLCDIAPTMLTLLNIPVPPEMTGHCLLKGAGRD